MNITEVAHKNKDLMARAQSAHAMAMSGLIRFPKFAPWWQRAEKELLMFPNGTHDDFISFLAHLGKGVHQMISPNKKRNDTPQEEVSGFNITPRLLKDGVRREKRLQTLARLN